MARSESVTAWALTPVWPSPGLQKFQRSISLNHLNQSPSSSLCYINLSHCTLCWRDEKTNYTVKAHTCWPSENHWAVGSHWSGFSTVFLMAGVKLQVKYYNQSLYQIKETSCLFPPHLVGKFEPGSLVSITFLQSKRIWIYRKSKEETAGTTHARIPLQINLQTFS